MALAMIQRSAPSRSTTPTRTQPPVKDYQNADGPGGTPINYGPSRGGGVPGQDPFAGGAAPYGSSGYYGSQRATTPMPNSGPGGPPIYTPALNDPRNAGYFYNDPRQAPGGDWDQQHAATVARGQQQIQNDPIAAQALASGDWKTMTQRLQQLGQQAQADRYIALGGGNSQQGWDSRFSQAWPTPTMANGQRGPGAPVTAGPSQAAAAPQSMSGGGNDPIGPGMDGRMDRFPNSGPQASADQLQAWLNMRLGQQGGGLMGGPASGSGYQPSGFLDPNAPMQGQRFTGGPATTGGNQAALAADAQRTMPGNFVPPSGPVGRPTTGPVSMPPSNPGDPRQLPPWAGRQPGWTPFGGSSWGGNVGYDTSGMGLMFGNGYLPSQFNPQMGGGFGSNMASPQSFGGGLNPQLMQMLMQQFGGGPLNPQPQASPYPYPQQAMPY